MTGSGKAQGLTELGQLTVEVRSVNGRSLALKTRLPIECQGIEPTLEKLVRARLKRGSVSISMDLTVPVRADDTLVDSALFARTVGLLRDLARDNGLDDSVSVSDVLRVPGVLPGSGSGSGSGSNSGAGRTRTSWTPSAELTALVEAALRDLISVRAVEGAATVVSMREQIAVLESELQNISARAPELKDDYRSRILQRVNDFLDQRGQQIEEDDLIREVSVFAEKVDISEELQRLETHLARLTELFDAGGEVGRKLEFLLQETLREVNTTGSKSPDVDLAHSVVAMKSAVDKLKEQAANLE